MINTEHQLRAASHRLGLDFEDMKALFLMSPSPLDNKKHSPFNFTNGALAFKSTAINAALDQTLLPICETAFGNPLSQDTSISPETSSPFSSASHDYPQNPDSTSAASVSSPAPALLHTNSSSPSDDLSVSPETPDHSESHSEHTLPRTRAVSRRTTNIDLPRRTSKRNFPSEEDQPTTPNSKQFVPLPSTSSLQQSPRLSPLQSILSFARGLTSSLADVSDLKKESAIRLVQSLSIIPGCDVYSDCCIFDYISVLVSSHLTMLQTPPGDRNAEDQTNVFVHSFEITETSWREHILARRSSTGKNFLINHPPMIRKTVDLLQFIYRLVDKISHYDDSLMGAFLEGLYTTGVPTLVASLTTKVLRPVGGPLTESEAERQGFLYEWCVRLLKDFIVYELSPVSRARNMKNIPQNKFAVCGFGKGDMPPLSTVIDYCFQAVSSHHTTKESRHALSELVQAFLIWSHARNTEGSSDSFPETISGADGHSCLDGLVSKDAFWTIVVQPLLQQVKKEPELSDSIFEYTFLTSLLGISAAKRTLFYSKHDKCKQMLLNLMIRILDLLNRDLLSSFLSAEEMRRLHPGVYTAIDFVHCMISSAVIQREILGSEAMTRGRFLSSLDSLIANTVKLVRHPIDAGESQKYAQKGPFAKVLLRDVDIGEADLGRESSRISQKKGISKTKIDDDTIAREKAVAFSARVIGCAGKSVEDGSWDMSQMNSMKALFQTRIISSRSRYRLWNDVYRIWRVVQRKIGHHLLLSTAERNSFAMVVEVVRKHAAYDSTDRTEGTASRDSDVADLETRTPLNTSSEAQANFPPIWEVREMQLSVCSPKGYTDLDNDRDIITLLKDGLISKGQQMLARYDPDSEFVVKWIRLLKKNSYIGRARELLERADRTVGLKCSCVPGYLKKGANGTETRIACSSDLCENRHMKIECVPGSCGAQSYCMNQRMQRMDYAKFKMISFPGKGIGIVADEDIPEGALIGEYQGEVVTMEEYGKRVREYEGERHFYFMTLTNKLVIDASRKSQATRFLNHSCDPNSETQKWNAEGEPRVGIFAKRGICKGEEITFDYGARSLARYSAKCLCGAENCRGLLALRQEDKDFTKQQASKGFSRPADTDERVQRMSADRAEEADGQSAEEDRRCSIIKEKIEVAKRYLHEAEELGKKVQENPSPREESVLTNDAREKLKTWKLSLSECSTPVFSLKPSKDIHVEVKFPRIPRKGAGSAQFDKRATEKSRDESSGRKGSSTRNSLSQVADPPLAAQRGRSSTPKRRVPSASRWALFEETFSAKMGPARTPKKRQADVDTTKRFSKLPKADFLPTTSKLKRGRPLRPKFAKRKRTRKLEENDSMDEYSTASEAEPILEEPIASTMKLPDGNGACSDDEFIAAPPVDSIQFSPFRQRWNHANPARTFDGRQGGRMEYTGTGQTQDGQRSRLGPGKVATRSGLVGYRTPDANGWPDGGGADFEDRIAPWGLPSETDGPRGHREHRHEWSASMEKKINPHSRSLDKRREEREAQETNNNNRQHYQRQPSFVPAFSPDNHESTYTRPRKEYLNSNRGTKPGGAKPSGHPVGSPRFQQKKDYNLRDTGVNDTNRSIPISQPQIESRPYSHDGQGAPHSSRFTSAAGTKPQNYNKQGMDWGRQYEQETWDVKSRNAKDGPKRDLRDIIGHRGRSDH